MRTKRIETRTVATKDVIFYIWHEIGGTPTRVDAVFHNLNHDVRYSRFALSAQDIAAGAREYLVEIKSATNDGTINTDALAALKTEVDTVFTTTFD